jgi:hypothetical protein
VRKASWVRRGRGGGFAAPLRCPTLIFRARRPSIHSPSPTAQTELAWAQQHRPDVLTQPEVKARVRQMREVCAGNPAPQAACRRAGGSGSGSLGRGARSAVARRSSAAAPSAPPHARRPPPPLRPAPKQAEAQVGPRAEAIAQLEDVIRMAQGLVEEDLMAAPGGPGAGPGGPGGPGGRPAGP